jgi:hypothetical protein
MVKARVGVSLDEFLCRQLKFSPAYIAQRIDAIFLDGRPVDDIDAAVITDGCTVALSGAMPGLAGAVMRRKSAYASFRRSISYRKNNRPSRLKPGMVRLKLFNIVMNDWGPVFLEKGIFVPSHDLTAVLQNQPREFWRGCGEIKLNQRPVDADLFADDRWARASDLVFFSAGAVKESR